MCEESCTLCNKVEVEMGKVRVDERWGGDVCGKWITIVINGCCTEWMWLIEYRV